MRTHACYLETARTRDRQCLFASCQCDSTIPLFPANLCWRGAIATRAHVHQATKEYHILLFDKSMCVHVLALSRVAGCFPGERVLRVGGLPGLILM